MIKKLGASLLAVFTALILSGCVNSGDAAAGEPIKIGVLMYLSGPEDIGTREVLDWGIEKINSEGGIDGRPIELVYKDQYSGDLKVLAREFVEDEEISVVIGPRSSAPLAEVAPMFIEAKKVLINPTSTSASINNLFSRQNYVWRMCQSDIAQAQAIFQELSQKNVENATLIYEGGIYGKTFYDWSPTFSSDQNINLISRIPLGNTKEDVTKLISQALKGNPQYVVAAVFTEDAALIQQELAKRNVSTKLFFTDAAKVSQLKKILGKESNGFEQISPTSNPESGFEESYLEKFGYHAKDYSPQTYDSLLLAAYTLARQQYSPGEDLGESFKTVVEGRGDKFTWDESKKAIKAISSGKEIDVDGASGTFEYDPILKLDPVKTFYGVNRMETKDTEEKGEIGKDPIQTFSAIHRIKVHQKVVDYWKTKTINATQKPLTLKVGVLMRLTGPDAVGSKEILDWSLGEINEKGGFEGSRKIELIYKDIHMRDVSVLAKELIENPEIDIVIGTDQSSEMYEVAPQFIEAKKLLISPTSTSQAIPEAFGGKGYVWRTCKSDVAQAKVIVQELHERSVENISLIYEDGVYGETFNVWINSYASNLNMTVYKSVPVNDSANISNIVQEVLGDGVEYVVGAVFAEDAVEIKQSMDTQGSTVKLFLTDGPNPKYVMETLGEASESIEHVFPTSSPESGFDEDYQMEFGVPPRDFTSQTYDSLLLAVYTLARQEYFPGEDWSQSLEHVVSGRGEKLGWNESGKAIESILEGKSVDVDGASGTLEYDLISKVDPKEVFYALHKTETRNGTRNFWKVKTVKAS